MSSFISYLFPKQITVPQRERLLSALAGFAAILAIALASHQLVGTDHLPFLAASMGASTVLLFAVPHSPFSQPWPFAGGHLVSALAGITCAKLIPDLYLAASLGVGLAIVGMYYLRCLHPPGGGTALLVVIGGPKLHALGYQFLLTPLLLNIVLLLGIALLVNYLIPGRRYPLNLSAPEPQTPGSDESKTHGQLSFDHEDLIAAMREIGAYIDVTMEDLEHIYGLASLHAQRRRLGELRCADIMTRNVITARSDMPLERVWDKLHTFNIRGMPVVDEAEKVVGVITVIDLLKPVEWRQRGSLAACFRALFRRGAMPTVEQVMSKEVVTVKEATHFVEMFRIFSERRINHLPVLDEENRLAGIVTRLDLLAALSGDLASQASA